MDEEQTSRFHDRLTHHLRNEVWIKFSQSAEENQEGYEARNGFRSQEEQNKQKKKNPYFRVRLMFFLDQLIELLEVGMNMSVPGIKGKREFGSQSGLSRGRRRRGREGRSSS
jgi:hypothetical protein